MKQRGAAVRTRPTGRADEDDEAAGTTRRGREGAGL